VLSGKADSTTLPFLNLADTTAALRARFFSPTSHPAEVAEATEIARQSLRHDVSGVSDNPFVFDNANLIWGHQVPKKAVFSKLN